MARLAFRQMSVLAFAAALAACATPDTVRADPDAPRTEASVRTIYADRTMIPYDVFHGTQIEYHRADGRSFLWYPGNARAVPANWRVQLDRNGHDICWQYPSRSYNPITGQTGGRWECDSDRSYFRGLSQIVVGDPFGLATGAVPFRLPKGRFDAETLAQNAGVPASRISAVTWENGT
jgi:hypothetical protein